MEAESEKGAGTRQVKPVQFNVHQIHLDVGEQRILQSFSPYDQIRVGEMILAKVELFGQTYTCRLLKPSQIRYELINAPPHCWIETEVKRKHAKKMENKSEDKTPRPVRARHTKRANRVGGLSSVVST